MKAGGKILDICIIEYLNAMFKAVELPTSVSHLDTSLTNVD